MKLLALDFDGVLFDSAREAFAVAVRTHAALDPASPLRGREDDAALYRGFLELMPLGNRAEDYAVALDALVAGRRLLDQASWDAFFRSRDPDRLRAFHERFYEERLAWSDADPEGWRALMAPYPEVRALLRRRAGDVRLAIATSKDRRSVRLLLEGYGLAALFPEASVEDKESGRRKSVHVERLARRHGLAPAQVTFVDDKVNHLHDVAPTGARCALAAWGYNGARERREAERAGFLVLHGHDAERKLFGAG